MKKIYSLIILGLLCLFANTAQADINYNQWKLTLPIDKNGLTIGEAIEVKKLDQSSSFPPYFTQENGNITFAAPAEGATTSGSHYPRSELREMDLKTGKEIAWKPKQGGNLLATLAVNDLPIKTNGGAGRIVIGQIHGKSNELCRLYYDKGVLYFHDDKSGSKKKEVEFKLLNDKGQTTTIQPDEIFDYNINVSKNILTVKANYKGVEYKASEPVGSYFKNDSLYFKAGVYVQVGKIGSGAGTVGTGTGKVTFYNIVASH